MQALPSPSAATIAVVSQPAWHFTKAVPSSPDETLRLACLSSWVGKALTLAESEAGVAQSGPQATSIGANVEEGQASQSRADFCSKNSIRFKESRETHHWLRLLAETEILKSEQLAPNT
jgi:hypothetical protein